MDKTKADESGYNFMKATETTILNFIGGFDKAFIIPPFQRNYEWGKEQCLELFCDIEKTCQLGRPHYLGNVIYYYGENSGASYTELVLIDGQQRVTSILLLLCALRDLIDDENVKKSINKRYLLNDTSDDRFRIRLKQTAYDSNGFNQIIYGEEPDNKNGNVALNYNYFTELIKGSNIDPKLIYESIVKVEVVEVNLQISNELDAVQTVFEKINSTGKPLSASDLIRNLLLTATSTKDQERLYNAYWIEIEKLLKNENISRFSRDYLIIKQFEDVPEKNIYKKFKEFFHEGSATNEDILKEMRKLSKRYAWLKFENCPDEYINRRIKMLNILKSEDLYPLYLLLIDSMYDDARVELKKIFNLLTDYMLRFRIVAPSGGGGDLRSIVQELIENISSGTVEYSYEAILYELSNSPSPNNRFPLDNEFKKQLMDSVNPAYAKVLLMKIDEHETKNIPVEINKITIEHLMPQTFTSWWKGNFGGEDKAREIQEKYLNCIGNLSIVSQSYNSSFKNYPWDKKKESLRDVQFVITSEIAQKYFNWKEENIQHRNINISERAVSALISPLKRERAYRSRDKSDSYTPGVYPLSDQSIPMNGSTITAVIYNNITYECNRWKDLLAVLVGILIDKQVEHLKEIVNKNLIHKATSKKNYPDKDPVISFNPEHLIEAVRVKNSNFYCEGCISNIRARVYAKQILDCFDDIGDVSIEIK